jgi:hypothetical protein
MSFAGQGSHPSSGNSSSGGLNNRFNSYQQGGGGSYVPPGSGRTYADQQTNVLEDTVKTHYQAEGTAANVLTQMHTQRHQIKGAHDDVWEMRKATEEARRELESLIAKNRRKKARLYAIIAALAMTDLLLFVRIAQCRGSFFC